MRHLPLDELSLDELKALSQQRGDPAVSLYMPMHTAGPSTRENHIRFKNHVQEAARMLESSGFDEVEAQEYLAPALALVDDNAFWQNQAKGLAYFLAEGFERHYRLPVAPAELTIVSERFHLKPILPLLSGNGRFCLLSASLNGARLFVGNRDDMYELEFGEDVPTSLEEALKYDEFERSVQFHGTSSSADPGRRSAVMYHGTGDGEDDRKMNILRFFRALDKGVMDALAKAESQGVPLVFAGVHYLFSIYREANHYNGLLDEHIEGSPDQMSEEELHQRAWALVEPHYLKAQEDAVARYHHEADSGQASHNLREILPAALDARVDTLFVAVDRQLWGRFDPESRSVTVHEGEQVGDEDLLDFAAVYTLLNGGTVFAVPPEKLPADNAQAAAIYRYRTEGHRHKA